MKSLLLRVQGTGAEPLRRAFIRHTLCATNCTCIIFSILTVALRGGTLIPIRQVRKLRLGTGQLPAQCCSVNEG